MENNLTFYFATFWGSYLIIASLLILIFPKLKTKILSFVTVNSNRVILGIALSVVGILHVSFHNIWISDISVIISVIGWVCVTKGIMLIAFNSWDTLFTRVLENNYFGFAILFMICLGIYMIQAVNSF